MAGEFERLDETYASRAPWLHWGPYLSERQWGTVREDYGDDENAWSHFPHEQAVARAYRWGEDGLAGISDSRQLICFALALWNGKDAVLKERLFGLANGQGNHGEDVKEYYYYLDNTPTHSFMRYLYKYPQAGFPYDDLVRTNAARGYADREYELLDTGVFDEDRYFDVEVQYAKADPDDVLIRVLVTNRGPDAALLRVLPTLWFRNVWSWYPNAHKPELALQPPDGNFSAVRISGSEAGDYSLYCAGAPRLLFTENETNQQALFGGSNASPFTKDGINAFVVGGDEAAVNPGGRGTKVAADYALTLAPGQTATLSLRLAAAAELTEPFGPRFDEVFQARREEADAFHATIKPDSLTADEAAVMRQALAGMLWTKQYYEYDVQKWIDEHHDPSHRRNRDWAHMKQHDVISMPDKWEYPWYAVWDLAFHALPLMLVDTHFAKEQLSLFVGQRYQRADGAIPAYEWNFSDVNPPVHAWATHAVYDFEKHANHGKGDLEFLRGAFEGLCRNFDWWAERKGATGTNVFEGGFLGLDNIGVFDRSKALPTGGRLEQSDGTAWMAFYAQSMLSIALELATHDPTYEEQVLVYLERFLDIASAMDKIGEHNDELWDERDGFFYDVLRFPDGNATRLKVRSLVGLLPLCAVTVINAEALEALPRLRERYAQLVRQKDPRNIACPDKPGVSGRRLLGVLGELKLRRVLARMLDEWEFLGAYGIRSMSRFHAEQPYVFHWEGREFRVAYLPGESDSGMFGGNSNWRGPVWMPMNLLLIRALLVLYSYYGDTFWVECPTGSGQRRTLYQVAEFIADRLIGIFLRDDQGRRPVFGGVDKFQNDPHWRDHLLFYEYFHGDDGTGMGASHQTGWTGAIALLLAVFGTVKPEDLKQNGFRVSGRSIAGPIES